jgi:PAS domain S-box-containing protein
MTTDTVNAERRPAPEDIGTESFIAMVSLDPDRQRAVERYKHLDTSRGTEFEDIVALARRLTGASAAGIALIGGGHVRIMFAHGIDATDQVLADTFVGHHFISPDVLVVPDARRDHRFAGLPAVNDHRQVRFYAGAPLVSSDGYVIGALFCADRSPGELDADTVLALAALARQTLAVLEMRRTEVAYHAVVEGAGHVVVLLDKEGRLVSVTPTWSRLTSYGVIRSLGERLTEFVHPDDQELVKERLGAARHESRSSRLECRVIGLTGSTVDVDVFIQPLLDGERLNIGLVGVISDISERRARELENHHAQRMESLGRLSAGLAHEINTPIQFVGDNTRFLAESYEAMLTLLLTYRRALDAEAGATSWAERRAAISQAEEDADIDYLASEVPSAVVQSLEGVDRVAQIVRAMKTFSHPGQDQKAPADLNEALQATVTVARSQVKDVADVELDLAEIPSVMCNIGDINQVFLNLIVNAGDAIAETGRYGSITISTSKEADDVLIQVRDTGPGIPENIRRKIFEPFFTTKPVGRGTGQGLALAQAVIKDGHSGALSVESEMGSGTTFTIRLPIAGAPFEDTP